MFLSVARALNARGKETKKSRRKYERFMEFEEKLENIYIWRGDWDKYWFSIICLMLLVDFRHPNLRPTLTPMRAIKTVLETHSLARSLACSFNNSTPTHPPKPSITLENEIRNKFVPFAGGGGSRPPPKEKWKSAIMNTHSTQAGDRRKSFTVSKHKTWALSAVAVKVQTEKRNFLLKVVKVNPWTLERWLFGSGFHVVKVKLNFFPSFRYCPKKIERRKFCCSYVMLCSRRGWNERGHRRWTEESRRFSHLIRGSEMAKVFLR